ncbi:serine/threonine-protein kinase [Nocardioides jensenii]|uniref:serine/threonine-protein kinase n=1 Tax=Nocardioides jensenii TaxID=1843 RepID=UPI0014706AF0|nr:serine/threonine-protein kinase [Nocardioides jensenii]
MLTPGSNFGPYRIESRLGSGGMGVVFAATDTRLGRRVALKVVSSNLAGDPGFAARFQREASILARLDSPHIVSIFEHGEHDGSAYIATQLVGGGDLGALLRSRGPLPRPAAVALVGQLAEALDDAHRSGIVHRDVKPANVLVRDPDAPSLFTYLCDFGIAQAGDLPGQHGQTATGAVAGSWAYLSPERLNGAPASPASDIYALGCVLWACLTGDAPYAGSDLQVAQAHVNAPVRQLPGVDARHLNTVLERAMAKDPTQRFASAGEFRAALLADGPRPLPPPAPRRPRKGGALIAACAALVIALGVGGAVWAIAQNDDDSNPGADDPSSGATSDTPATDTTTETTSATTDPTDTDEPGSRAAVLTDAIVALFPAGTPEDPKAHTWSVTQGNIVDGMPRDLDPSEWDIATQWTVDSRSKDYSVSLRVSHIPSDDKYALTATCKDLNSELSACRLLTAADGTVALETWFHIDGSTELSHRVSIPGDLTTGRPEISVGERIQRVPASAAIDKLKSKVRITGDTLLATAQNPDLLFPRPDTEPPLPSYYACISDPQHPPAGCPDGL